MAEELNTTGLALPPDQAGAIDIRAPKNLKEAFTVSQYLASSGIFKDVNQARKAFGLVAIGMDLGLTATQSIRSIHIIEGKPELGADVIACLLKKAGYRWKIKELTRERCELLFFDPDGNELGISDFDTEDAKAAGLAGKQNWRAYARNMLFARCISNGAKWYAAEIFGGAVYHRGEIDQAFLGDPGDPDHIPEEPPGAPEPEEVVIDAEVIEDDDQGEVPVISADGASETLTPSSPEAASVAQTAEEESSPEPGQQSTPQSPEAPQTAEGTRGTISTKFNMNKVTSSVKEEEPSDPKPESAPPQGSSATSPTASLSANSEGPPSFISDELWAAMCEIWVSKHEMDVTRLLDALKGTTSTTGAKRVFNNALKVFGLEGKV